MSVLTCNQIMEKIEEHVIQLDVKTFQNTNNIIFYSFIKLLYDLCWHNTSLPSLRECNILLSYS